MKGIVLEAAIEMIEGEKHLTMLIQDAGGKIKYAWPLSQVEGLPDDLNRLIGDEIDLEYER